MLPIIKDINQFIDFEFESLYIIVAYQRRMPWLDEEFPGLPFKPDKSQRQLLSQIQQWWHTQGLIHFVRAISHPLTEKSCIILIYWIIMKVSHARKKTNVVYLVESVVRAKFLLDLANYVMRNYLQNDPTLHIPILCASYQRGTQIHQIVFTTMKQFVRQDVPHENIYSAMILETSNFTRMIGDSFKDYITDVYIRRAYIEMLKYQQAYKDNQKNIRNISKQSAKLQNSQPIIEVKQFPLINLQSKQSNQMNDVQQPINQTIKEISNPLQIPKRITKKTYQTKKQLMLKKINKQQDKDGVMEQQATLLYQQNQLILIYSLIYVMGYFYSIIQKKQTKNIFKFLHSFQNATILKSDFLGKAMDYCKKIHKNCPIKIYENLQTTYLYAFCNFIDKIVLYRKIFEEDYNELFILRADKFLFQNKQSNLTEQSGSILSIQVQQNSKIYKSLLKKKSLNSLILQNFACPNEYWKHLFRIQKLLLNDEPQMGSFSRIYGLHISKTTSNQNINFAQISKNDTDKKIKLKACGVLIYQLSKFIPDGIVIYFNSMQCLESFKRENEGQLQKAWKKIEELKRIFIESTFQQQNIVNFNKFKKCCQVGRGAIFCMVANGKVAQYLKFYRHLSRCIVFFGLPKKQSEKSKQKLVFQQYQNFKDQDDIKQVQQLDFGIYERICIINQCLNNCINNLSDYKCVIFVGEEITDDLQVWYKYFIKSWGETTRQSLRKLIHHFQKMGRQSISQK